MGMVASRPIRRISSETLLDKHHDEVFKCVKEDWFIFYFESEDDQDKVLKERPYFIHGRLIILKHISEKFAFNSRDIATISLWVQIFGLSRTFWTPEVLGRIASQNDKPLFMDHVMDSRKHGAYARMLAEINFAEPITREVSLKFEDEDVLGYTFLIENELKYCKICCSFRYIDDECSFKEKNNGIGANSRKSSKASKSNVKSENVKVVNEVVPEPLSASICIFHSLITTSFLSFLMLMIRLGLSTIGSLAFVMWSTRLLMIRLWLSKCLASLIDPAQNVVVGCRLMSENIFLV